MADLAVWQRSIVDEEGNVIPGAEVTVRRASSGTLADIYTDREGTTPAPNPMEADANGFVRFFADGGAYQVEAYGAGQGSAWSFVAVGKLAEADEVTAEQVTSDPAEVEAIRVQIGAASIGEVADAIEPAVDLASAPASLPEEFPDAQSFAFGFTDRDGNVLAGIDGEGDWRTKERAEFPDEGGLVYAVTDEQGRVLLGFDHEGGLVAQGGVAPGGAGLPQIGYLDGTTLYAVGADEEPVADLGGYTVEALAPGNTKSVRAVIARPMIGNKRSVSVGESGLLIPDSDKVLHIVIGLGQSLMVGAQSADSLISTEAQYPDMVLMPDVGPYSDVRLGLKGSSGEPGDFDPNDFTGFRPLVARVGITPTQGETVMEQFANALAREAHNIGIRHRTLLFTAAFGGTNYEGLKKGTQVYSNMLAALAKAQTLAEDRGWQVVVDACVVRHGEADASNPNYGQDLLEWQEDTDADLKSITGQQAPVHFLIAQPSSFYGSDTQAAQRMVEVSESSPHHHLAGPDYGYADLYADDILHGTGPFYFLSGEYLARAFRQVIWSAAEDSTVTRIISAERSGTTVTLTYEVPEPPLVIDTASVSERDVRGFRYAGGGGATITAVTVTGPQTIELTLASEPSGDNEVVHYAMSGHSGSRDTETIPRGNVRDSAGAVSAWDGRPLYNWAVHQRVPVTVN